MQERFQIAREKFKDVVHLAIHDAAGQLGKAALGNTKLHKIVYYADMLQIASIVFGGIIAPKALSPHFLQTWNSNNLD